MRQVKGQVISKQADYGQILIKTNKRGLVSNRHNEGAMFTCAYEPSNDFHVHDICSEQNCRASIVAFTPLHCACVCVVFLNLIEVIFRFKCLHSSFLLLFQSNRNFIQNKLSWIHLGVYMKTFQSN